MVTVLTPIFQKNQVVVADRKSVTNGRIIDFLPVINRF